MLLLLSQAVRGLDWAPVNSLVEQAISQRLFPAAYLGVSLNGSVLLAKTFGTAAYQSLLREFGAEDAAAKWDLGELTGQLATVASFMRLYEDNKTDFRKPVTDYVAAYSYHLKENTTLEELLLHTSGLPQSYSFSPKLSYSQLLQEVAHQAPVHRIGHAYLYSNLNYLMLGECIARTFAYSSFREAVFESLVFLGLRGTGYTPDPAKEAIVPTFYNRSSGVLDRGRGVDGLLPALGGVGPHAGLFGVGSDILRFMHILLAKGKLANEATRYFKEETVAAFVARVSNPFFNNTRARGFETKPHGRPPCGDKFSSLSFGMNASEGSYVWADS